MTNYINEKLLSINDVRAVTWQIDKDLAESVVPSDLTENGAKFGSLQTALIVASRYPTTKITINVLIGPHPLNVSISNANLSHVYITGSAGTSNVTGSLTLFNVTLGSIDKVNFFGGCFLTNVNILSENSMYFADLELNNCKLQFSVLAADSIIIDNGSSLVVNRTFDIQPQEAGEAIAKVSKNSSLILRGSNNTISNGYLVVSNNSSAVISQLETSERLAAVNYSQIYAPSNITFAAETIVIAKNSSYIELDKDATGDIKYYPAPGTIDYSQSQIKLV